MTLRSATNLEFTSSNIPVAWMKYGQITVVKTPWAPMHSNSIRSASSKPTWGSCIPIIQWLAFDLPKHISNTYRSEFARTVVYQFGDSDVTCKGSNRHNVTVVTLQHRRQEGFGSLQKSNRRKKAAWFVQIRRAINNNNNNSGFGLLDDKPLIDILEVANRIGWVPMPITYQRRVFYSDAVWAFAGGISTRFHSQLEDNDGDDDVDVVWTCQAQWPSKSKTMFITVHRTKMRIALAGSIQSWPCHCWSNTWAGQGKKIQSGISAMKTEPQFVGIYYYYTVFAHVRDVYQYVPKSVQEYSRWRSARSGDRECREELCPKQRQRCWTAAIPVVG